MIPRTKNVDVYSQTFEPGGGLNTLGDPFSIAENESPDVIDVLFNQDGSIGKRYGYERLNDASIDPSYACNGIFDYGVSPGVRKLVGAWGTTLQKVDDLDGTWDSLETGRSDVTHYFERSGTDLIICNENKDTIKYWDGSSATLTNLNSSAPLAQIPKSFQGYLFLANTTTNPRRIYYEDESTIKTGDFGEYFTLPSSSDDEVVALVEYNGRLYASLRTEWYRISYVGGSAVFDYKKVSSVIGGVAKTIQVVSLPNVGEVIMYMGWNKKVYIFDETSSYPISINYERDNGQSTVFLDNVNQGGISRCHATVDTNNNFYRLYVPMGENSTITHSFNINLNTLACSVFKNQRFLSGCMAEDSNKRRWHITGDYYGTAYRMDRTVIDSVPANIEMGTDGSLTSAESYALTDGRIVKDKIHDGGDNKTTYAQDTSENFVTEGLVVGDYIVNKTDGCRGVITTIGNGGGTNDRLTCSAGFTGGTDNEFDDDDVFDVYKGIFIANNDSIYIGSPVKFDYIFVTLIRPSGDGINMNVGFSTDDAGGYTLGNVTDGTSGFTKTGPITFTPPSAWVVTAKDDGGNAFNDTNSYYYVRLQRTDATIAVGPILLTIEVGNRVDEYYTSPKIYGDYVSDLKKGARGKFYFEPRAKYTLTYSERRDFERTWKDKDNIPMYSKKDDFLAGNDILNSNELGSRQDGIEWPINLSVVTNSYQYRLKSNQAANLPWKLDRVEIAGKVMGMGSSRHKGR